MLGWWLIDPCRTMKKIPDHILKSPLSFQKYHKVYSYHGLKDQNLHHLPSVDFNLRTNYLTNCLD